MIRALSGLWKDGGGTITRLPDEEILCLPQKPYLPLLETKYNTLWSQLAFPRAAAVHKGQSAKLKEILKAVNLEHLLQYDRIENPYVFCFGFFLFVFSVLWICFILWTVFLRAN